MSENDDEKKFLDALRGIAEMVALGLSMEHHFTEIAAKVPYATWEMLFKESPSWYEFYFVPPLELLKRIFELKSVQESLRELDPVADPLEKFQMLLIDNRTKGREVATIWKELSEHDRPIVFNLGNSEIAETVAEIVTFKALAAEIRARSFHGQGMHSFIVAGQRGNDLGYLRAVEIDPTVQWHPALVDRVSREDVAGRREFARKLRKAAESGPSQRIDKDLHQLRYMLGIFEELGMLKELSDAERYELFCIQLGLYPNTGENPKAAVCTFIKRWRRSRVR